jgi:hypothetical protein
MSPCRKSSALRTNRDLAGGWELRLEPIDSPDTREHPGRWANVLNVRVSPHELAPLQGRPDPQHGAINSRVKIVSSLWKLAVHVLHGMRDRFQGRGAPLAAKALRVDKPEDGGVSPQPGAGPLHFPWNRGPRRSHGCFGAHRHRRVWLVMPVVDVSNCFEAG